MCYVHVIADIISVSCTFAESTYLVPINIRFVIAEDGRRRVCSVLSNSNKKPANVVIFCVYHNIFRIDYYTCTWSKASYWNVFNFEK